MEYRQEFEVNTNKKTKKAKQQNFDQVTKHVATLLKKNDNQYNNDKKN